MTEPDAHRRQGAVFRCQPLPDEDAAHGHEYNGRIEPSSWPSNLLMVSLPRRGPPGRWAGRSSEAHSARGFSASILTLPYSHSQGTFHVGPAPSWFGRLMSVCAGPVCNGAYRSVFALQGANRVSLTADGVIGVKGMKTMMVSRSLPACGGQREAPLIPASDIMAAMSDVRPGRFYSVDELASVLRVQDKGERSTRNFGPWWAIRMATARFGSCKVRRTTSTTHLRRFQAFTLCETWKTEAS